MNHNIYLGVGTNLGRRSDNIRQALCSLQEVATVAAVSPACKSKAWGVKNQPSFINLVLKISTKLNPRELLKVCQQIEQDMGRVKTEKWGPRLIDIDILLYADRIIHQKDLIIPHPYLAQREFVLLPLLKISPDLIHPGLQKSIKRLYEDYLIDIT